MNGATLDASVLVAASSPNDLFFRPSRAVLSRLQSARLDIIEPAFARVEVACALARVLRNGAGGRQLASALFDSLHPTEVGLTEYCSTWRCAAGQSNSYVAPMR